MTVHRPESRSLRPHGIRKEKEIAARVVGPTFARHETFAPRYGWLKKGFDAVAKDGIVFTRDDVAALLGVGKNMARSIRYWTVACGLVEETTSAGGRGTTLRPTEFGKCLLGPGGWDPYLEDLSSLWLLHWKLLRSDGLATAWHYTFFEFTLNEFSADDLSWNLAEMVKKRFPSARAAASSLRKDAVCLIQMYAGGTRNIAETEESVRSPFAELDLLGPGISSRHVVFRTGAKPGLSSAIIAALCLDFMRTRGSEMSVSLSTLLRGQGSPGLALRLSEASLYDALEQTVRQFSELKLSDTAGLIQFSSRIAPAEICAMLLDAHYADTLVGVGTR
jgi:Protein of unknown function (DUF4007)